jgi:uncharacterized protein YegL
MTIMPSLYGKNNLVFHSHINEGIILSDDLLRFYQEISSAIKQEAEKKKPVLIFFDTEKNMSAFLTSGYGQELKKYAATNRLMFSQVTEGTSNVKWFVEERATKPNAISFWTTSFGRGTDFKVVHQEVDDVGGVTVILTTFCQHPSDCIQYQGRTARQGKKGTLKMILYQPDLQHQYAVSAEEIEKEAKGFGFLPWLEMMRDRRLDQQFQIQAQSVQSYSEAHQQSEQFRKQLIDSHTSVMISGTVPSLSVSSIVTSLISFSGVTMSTSLMDIYHVIFCLDESGSMSPIDWKALTKAYTEFLKIFQKATAPPRHSTSTDRFSVIQFSYNSRIVFKSLKVDEALKVTLTKNNGGTEFAPALEDADKIMSGDTLSTKILLILMTDGDNTDPQLTKTVARRLNKKYGDRLEFYGVGFKEIENLKHLPELVALFKNGHLVSFPLPRSLCLCLCLFPTSLCLPLSSLLSLTPLSVSLCLLSYP